MNEKQLQEVMALVDALVKEAYSSAASIAVEDPGELRAAIESALREQVHRAPDAAVPSVPSPFTTLTIPQPAQAEQPKMVTPYITQKHFDRAFPVEQPKAQQREPMTDEQCRLSFERRMLDFGWRDFDGLVTGVPPCWYYSNSNLNARWIGWREASRFHNITKDKQ